jgi:hypothetical protein
MIVRHATATEWQGFVNKAMGRSAYDLMRRGAVEYVEGDTRYLPPPEIDRRTVVRTLPTAVTKTAAPRVAPAAPASPPPPPKRSATDEFLAMCMGQTQRMTTTQDAGADLLARLRATGGE